MAHELDITDGQVSFANSRSDAWHRLGQSVGHAMTAREALQAAHLAGWNVRKMALQVPQEPFIDDAAVIWPSPLVLPDFYATVRTNPINGDLDVLGVVGSRYEPVQNEASCELLDALVDASGGAHFETAGALRGGREILVTMKLPDLDADPLTRILKVRAGELTFHAVPDSRWSYRARAAGHTYLLAAGIGDEPMWTVAIDDHPPVAYDDLDAAVDTMLDHHTSAAA